jgi:two-component system, NarL family, invasion response regulator UvrY
MMGGQEASVKTVTARTKNRISVLLVDDHAVVREGYRRLLDRQGEIAVIGEADEAATAHSLFISLNPQVVVMDITLPVTSGLEAMRRMLLYSKDARVLIFSMHEDAIFAIHALRRGAYGYVTKASAPNVLVEAVLAVADGRKYLSPEIAQKIALLEGADTPHGLTERECDVLRMVIQGQTVPQIAEALGLNAKTVANHQTSVRQKLGADTAIDLLRKAKALGLSE